MKSVVVTQQIELDGKVYYPGAAVVSDAEATALDDADGLTGEAVDYVPMQDAQEAFLEGIPAEEVVAPTGTALTAIAASYADLAAARTSVNSLATEVEARFDNVELTVNAVIARLVSVGVLTEEEA